MAEVIKEIKYESLTNFIDDISYNGKLYNAFERNYIFRGLSSDKYNLIPNALRQEEQESLWKLSGHGGAMPDWEFDQIRIEFALLQRFFNKCDYSGLSIPNVHRLRADMIIKLGIDTLLRTNTWIPDDLFEIAGIAQHYGIPTRLLDWTQDLFVALYFAASGALKENHKKKSKYMVIWALNSTLVDTFRYEKPLKIIIPQYNSNSNLCAQKGLFTLWQVKIPIKGDDPFKIDTSVFVNRTPLDTLINNEPEICEIDHVLYKILIPISEAKNLYGYLRHLGYDASRLFPGYSGIRQCIEEDSLFFDMKTCPYPPKNEKDK